MPVSRRSYREIKRRSPSVSTPLDPSLSELQAIFLTYQESRNLSAYTLRNYHQTFASLEDYADERQLAITAATMTTEFVRDYQRWLQTTPLARARKGSTTRTAGGVAVRMRQVRAFIKFLDQEGYLGHDVQVRLPKLPPRDIQVLSAQQLSALFHSRYLLGDSAMAKRNRALLALLLDTGLRVAEAADIRDDHLFRAEQMVRVVGKGNKPRMVPYSDATSQLLDEWLTAREMEPVALKPAVRGRTFELQRTGIQMLLQRIGEDLGFPFRLHPHLLRHTAATTMLRQGMDVLTLKRILGHDHVSTTELYVHLVTDDLRAKHAAASPMLVVEPPAPQAPKRRLLHGPRHLR